MQGPTASFPRAAWARDTGRQELGLEGPSAPPRTPAEPRERSREAAPMGTASLPAMELAAGVRGWKEVHRKQERAAINPVKSNDVFSSIFSRRRSQGIKPKRWSCLI